MIFSKLKKKSTILIYACVQIPPFREQLEFEQFKVGADPAFPVGRGTHNRGGGTNIQFCKKNPKNLRSWGAFRSGTPKIWCFKSTIYEIKHLIYNSHRYKPFPMN